MRIGGEEMVVVMNSLGGVSVLRTTRGKEGEVAFVLQEEQEGGVVCVEAVDRSGLHGSRGDLLYCGTNRGVIVAWELQTGAATRWKRSEEVKGAKVGMVERRGEREES